MFENVQNDSKQAQSGINWLENEKSKYSKIWRKSKMTKLIVKNLINILNCIKIGFMARFHIFYGKIWHFWWRDLTFQFLERPVWLQWPYLVSILLENFYRKNFCHQNLSHQQFMARFNISYGKIWHFNFLRN